MLDITVVILASGSGSRLGGSVPKQFVSYKGKPLLEWSIDFFNNLSFVKEIILVLSEEYIDKINSYIALENYPKVSHIVIGGATRQLSSNNGLNKVSSKYVLIHDAARPNLNTEMIDRITIELNSYTSVVPCIASSNTIYELNAEGEVDKVLDRNSLGIVQTPQAFRTQTIKEAHEKAKQEDKSDFTDDAGMLLYYKLGKVKTVVGDELNIKVTYNSDLE
jgi:2-C-methyl-D-erythritol 4-phosphate cytidylyltransferase